MKNPTRNSLEARGYKIDEITDENPLKSKYNLKYAKKTRILVNNGHIERQRFKGASFYINYYEVDLEEPESLPFNFSHSNVYFSFIIKGKFEMHNIDGDFIKKIKNKSYYPSYNAEGEHNALFETGITRIFTIVFRSDWPKLNFLEYPHLSPLAGIIGMQERPKGNITFMHVRLIEDLHILLKKIFNLEGLHVDIRVDIKKTIAQICTLYNIQVDEKLQFSWILAEAHMHRHKHDPYLKIEHIIGLYAGNKRSSFFKNFKEEFDCTPAVRWEQIQSNKDA